MAVNPIKGKQLADAPNGVSTIKINDDAVTSAKVDGSVLSTDAANTPPGSDYSALTKKITNLADPTADTDAVNLRSLQTKVAWKQNVSAATAAVLPNNPTFASTPGGSATLTATGPFAALVIDGVNITKIGQRVLVKDEVFVPGTDKNGIYELTQQGFPGPIPAAQAWILTRAPDQDASAEIPGTATAALGGTANADKVFAVTTPAVPAGAFVLNQDQVVWTQLGSFSVIAGTGITVTGGDTVSVDIDPTPTAPPNGAGLTFVGNKLRIALTPLAGLKFNDLTGTLEPDLANTPNVEGGLVATVSGQLAAKFEPNSGLTVGANAGLVINPKNNAVPSGAGALALIANELVAQVNTNEALQVNNVNQIEVKRATTTPTVGSTGGIGVSAADGLLVNGDVLSTIDTNAVPTNNYNALTKQVKNAADATDPQDLVTFSQLQGVVQGLDWKDNVVTATDAALPAFTWSAPGGGTLTANANNALSIGGVPVTASMRVLVKDEVGGNAPYNGIYTVTQPGDNLNPYILVRAVDANTDAKVTNGLATTVTDTTATTFGLIYILTTPDPIVLNTTALTFSSIPLPAGYTAGNGIDITGLVISALLGNSNPAIEFQGNNGLGLKTGNPANDPPGITRSAAGAYVNVNNKKQWSDALTSAGTGTAVTADTVDIAPWRDNNGEVIVTATINGVEYEVANGGPPAAASLYFSPDGIIIRTWNAITVGDGLYRGGALGFDTDATVPADRICFTYLASIP